MGATGNDACLARYDTNGVVDATFGAGGKVTTPTGPGAATDIAYSISIQSDGKYVTVGTCDMGATGNDACLARYNTNGTLDATFGPNGQVTTSTGAGGANDQAW